MKNISPTQLQRWERHDGWKVICSAIDYLEAKEDGDDGDREAVHCLCAYAVWLKAKPLNRADAELRALNYFK